MQGKSQRFDVSILSNFSNYIITKRTWSIIFFITALSLGKLEIAPLTTILCELLRYGLIVVSEGI